MRSDQMKNKSRKIDFKMKVLAAIVCLALVGLTGCGIGHGSYQHGNDRRNVNNGSYNYRNGHDHNTHDSNGSCYYSGPRANGSIKGHGPSGNSNYSQ